MTDYSPEMVALRQMFVDYADMGIWRSDPGADLAGNLDLFLRYSGWSREDAEAEIQRRVSAKD